MPKYFFDIEEDGVLSCDDEGLDLRDVEAAKAEAMAALPALAREVPLDREAWLVRSLVRDERGRVVVDARLEMNLRRSP